ncbi:MAG: flagellar biosynthesis protein FlhF [Nitrospirae bacterium]|nr:flagellar biosynthesis protein FlhF [Nitrospirota bacterium]
MKIKKFQARTFAEALVMVKKELSEDAIILSTEERKGDNPMVEVTAAVDYDMSTIRSPRINVTVDDEIKREKPGRSDRQSRFPATSKFSLPAKKGSPADDRPAGTSSGDSIFERTRWGCGDDRLPVNSSSSSGGSRASNASKVSPSSSSRALDASRASGATGALRPAQVPEVEKTLEETLSQSAPPAELKHFVKKLSDDIKGEIESLRDSIEDMKNVGYEMALPPKKRTLLYFLRERSIREEYAILLCEKAKEIKELTPLLVSQIKVKTRGSDLKAIMLVGPTGVGKTTTVAKLAARSIKEGKKTAIINLDTYRIGAVEQSRIYSRILGIPLSVVSNERELKQSLMRFAETKDVIYIDTTGRSPKDEQYIESLNEICRTEVPLEVHLLMSANSDDDFLTESYRYYRRLPINYLGFTKVDEAVRYGSIYNLLLTYRKPIAYITMGQKVPDDLEFARVDNIANLILKKEYYRC